MIEENYYSFKDQTFRLFEQSELSDFIHDDENIRTKSWEILKENLQINFHFYTLFWCGCSCWCCWFLTRLLRKNKLIDFSNEARNILVFNT